MKKFIMLGALASAMVAGYGLSSLAKSSKAGPVDLSVGAIEATSITIRSGDGKTSLTMASTETGVNMWLGNKDKPTEAFGLMSNYGHPAVGFFGGEDMNGCSLAFSAPEGEPLLQWRDKDGKIRIINIATITK